MCDICEIWDVMRHSFLLLILLTDTLFNFCVCMRFLGRRQALLVKKFRNFLG